MKELAGDSRDESASSSASTTSASLRMMTLAQNQYKSITASVLRLWVQTETVFLICTVSGSNGDSHTVASQGAETCEGCGKGIWNSRSHSVITVWTAANQLSPQTQLSLAFGRTDLTFQYLSRRPGGNMWFRWMALCVKELTTLFNANFFVLSCNVRLRLLGQGGTACTGV